MVLGKKQEWKWRLCRCLMRTMVVNWHLSREVVLVDEKRRKLIARFNPFKKFGPLFPFKKKIICDINNAYDVEVYARWPCP
jgi:hypothetical protein